MNDNKSRDIFYGVVAVATLIVAIVGATLAYFSITAGSEEGAVKARAAVVSVNYTDGTKVITQAKKLIPSSMDIMQFFYEKNKEDLANATPSTDAELAEDPTADDEKNPCKDVKGNQVCSVFRFNVSTDAGEQYIKAYLYTESNTFRTNNLAYAVRDANCSYTAELGNQTANDYFNSVTTNYTSGTTINGPYEKCWLNLGTDDDPVKYSFIRSCSDDEENTLGLGLCYTENGNIKTYNASGENKSINSVFGIANNTEKTVKVTAATSTYDLVIFLYDNHENQDIDQGAEFKGTLKVEVIDTAGGNGQITGRVNNN